MTPGQTAPAAARFGSSPLMAQSDLARWPIILYFSPMTQLSHPVHSVCIVVFDDVQLLDFAGPLQTFATAEERRTSEKIGNPAQAPKLCYRPFLASNGGGEITSSSGVTVLTQHLPKTLAAPSTIIIAGGHGVAAAARDKTLTAWLTRQHAAGHRICSVCTGAFILAEAGLLDNRAATTHWADCNAFSRAFPNVRLDPKAIYTEDEGVWTSAGITAGIDLALALIERDCSAHLANATARWLVVYAKRAGGQSQFSDALELASRDADGLFTGLHDWMSQNMDRDINLAMMADSAGMSQRTLSRKYKEATGLSPAKALRLLRAQKAKTLLSTTRATLKSVSRQSGFQSVDAMNRALEAVYGAAAKLLRDTHRQTRRPSR